MLHGDGSPTRRYLFAADAADAFDTILHKGSLGHIYNVGSYDEISNIKLCNMLLKEMGIPNETKADFDKWVKYTHDRPFNDHRYAVDGTKLRNLGWVQKTTFAEGLRITVDWYRRFGEEWWGDISKVLSPFPIVVEAEVHSDREEICDKPQSARKRKVCETPPSDHDDIHDEPYTTKKRKVCDAKHLDQEESRDKPQLAKKGKVCEAIRPDAVTA